MGLGVVVVALHDAVLKEMYPRLPEFRKLRTEIDRSGALASDLSRRLGL